MFVICEIFHWCPRPNWWWVGGPSLVQSLPIRKTLGASPRLSSQHPVWVMTVFKLFKWPPFSAKCGQPDPRPEHRLENYLASVRLHKIHVLCREWEQSWSIWLTSVHPESQIRFMLDLASLRTVFCLNWESSVEPWLTSWLGSQIKPSQVKHSSVSRQKLQTIFHEMMLRAFHSFTTWYPMLEIIPISSYLEQSSWLPMQCQSSEWWR